MQSKSIDGIYDIRKLKYRTYYKDLLQESFCVYWEWEQMKKVLILEDKKENLSLLVNIIQGMQKEIEVYQTTQAGEAYQIALEKTVDVFLLDIVLKPESFGDMSGMVFADRIRQVEKYKFTPIIFLTALGDPELHAYKELHCYGYLTKPYNKEKLTKLLGEALTFEQHKEENRNIYFKKDGIFFAKKMQDIVYIKSSAGKMFIKTTKDELEISYKSNSQVLKELDSDNFIKCNRSVVVNKDYIASIDSTNRYIELKNGYGTLEIGAILKKDFLKEIFK